MGKVPSFQVTILLDDRNRDGSRRFRQNHRGTPSCRPARLGIRDADDFHPCLNVEKIRQGIGLYDQDRQPWLQALHQAIAHWIDEDKNAVLACSALKRSYRQELEVGPEVRFVYLKGSAELIAERLCVRKGHYADAQILASQFADLEEPDGRADRGYFRARPCRLSPRFERSSA